MFIFKEQKLYLGVLNMHIQGTNFPKFINYNGVNRLNFLNIVRNNFVSNKSENDAFVKNSTPISFAGEIENVKKLVILWMD